MGDPDVRHTCADKDVYPVVVLPQGANIYRVEVGRPAQDVQEVGTRVDDRRASCSTLLARFSVSCCFSISCCFVIGLSRPGKKVSRR